MPRLINLRQINVEKLYRKTWQDKRKIPINNDF